MKRYLLCYIFTFGIIGLYSQQDLAQPESIGKRAGYQQLKPAGQIQPSLISGTTNWSASLRGPSNGINHDVPNVQTYLAAKQAATARKNDNRSAINQENLIESNNFKLVTHEDRNFQGNRFNNFFQ